MGQIPSTTGTLTKTIVISKQRVFVTIGYVYKYPGITLSCSNVVCTAPQKCQMKGSLPYCVEEVTSLWRIVIPSPTKQFYISNGKESNRIQVVPTAKLTFMGRVYNSGSKLAFQLRPYQVVQILSTGALTKTKVISQHRVFITIGYIYKYPGITLSCSNVVC